MYQQSLQIEREIGNQQREAASLFNQAVALAALSRYCEAWEKLEQAKKIYTAIGLDRMVEQCDDAINKTNQAIAE